MSRTKKLALTSESRKSVYLNKENPILIHISHTIAASRGCCCYFVIIFISNQVSCLPQCVMSPLSSFVFPVMTRYCTCVSIGQLFRDNVRTFTMYNPPPHSHSLSLYVRTSLFFVRFPFKIIIVHARSKLQMTTRTNKTTVKTKRHRVA